jgi:hypothetical protein
LPTFAILDNVAYPDLTSIQEEWDNIIAVDVDPDNPFVDCPNLTA